MRYFLIGTLTVITCLEICGCNNSDNRTPDPAEVKAATDKRLKYIDTLKISPEAKAVIASHSGGPAYTPPGEVAAMAAMAAHNAKAPPGARKF